MPTRTCVGCRQRASVSDLLRVVAIASVTDSGSADAGSAQLRLRPDPSRVLPGRGAHVHPVPGCLDSALRRRAFGRALRVPGVPDPGELSEAIAALIGSDPGSSGPSRQSA